MRIVNRDQFPSVSFRSHDAIIFGEIHTPNERDEIENLIIRCHRQRPFTYLLSEEAGSKEVYTNPGKVQAIKDMEWTNSPRSYELGISMKIPVIGIDLLTDDVFAEDKRDIRGRLTDCSRSFALREAHMREVILNHTFKQHRIAVILGDTHLRQEEHPIVGARSVLNDFEDRDFLIVRSPIGEAK